MSGLWQPKPAHVFHYLQGMRIDCIDVEKIVLHLAHDLAELRQVAAENAVARHASQLKRDFVGGAQQLHKKRHAADISPELVIDAVAIVADKANSRGSNTCDFRILCTQHEGFNESEGRSLEHLRINHFEAVVVNLKAAIERTDLIALIAAQDDLVEMLQQQIVESAHGADGAVVALHEFFNSKA